MVINVVDTLPRLEEEHGHLGRGGFGCVKRGRWGKLIVAVKEITKAVDRKVHHHLLDGITRTDAITRMNSSS